ncbi:RAMP superfamily CRISPR-associated protein [Saccharopolyspora hattusasensis]|uniref:RAMP superfamily CRISPR-associated protein n=1 Tax=Saccharopolyspora hattusasensis TaxID=1128679 RepID=UPI003D99BEA5
MKVLLLTARIRLETEGGVIGTEVPTERGSDLQLRRDPAGGIHLPGTTVAGSLREHCGQELDDLFGSQPEERKGTDSEDFALTPSAIQVLGTRYRRAVDDPELEETRHHARTAIDRSRGAARNNALHRVEQLPRGTEFDIMLRWNDPDQRRERFLAKLKSWHPRLGRGVTTGAGKCRLIGWGAADYDLTTPEGLLDWVRRTGLDSYPAPTSPSGTTPEAELLNVQMTIVDGLHCGVGDDNKPEEAAREVFRLDGAPAIPGSTLKGVLRSRAEYICRVIGVPACDGQSSDGCRPCRIFGSGGHKPAWRGAIVVHTAVIENPVEQELPHVAIDRFSGGYKDGALYKDKLVVAGQFRLRVERIGKLEDGDVQLLMAVVADLDEGLIGIGQSTTRGYGTVRIADPGWQAPDLASLASTLRKDAA